LPVIEDMRECIAPEQWKKRIYNQIKISFPADFPYRFKETDKYRRYKYRKERNENFGHPTGKTSHKRQQSIN
jgi:hypothetical protein